MSKIGLRGMALLPCLGCTQFEPGEDVLLNTSIDTNTGSSLPAESEAPATPSPEASPLDDPWWCLNPSQTAALGRTRDPAGGNSVVALRLPVHDQFTQRPPEGVLVRLCGPTDGECSTPLVDWTPLPADGSIVQLVDWGFDGFFELAGPNYPPTSYRVFQPVVRDLSLYSHVLVPMDAFDSLSRAFMRPFFTDTTGTLFLTVLDCNGDFAPEVQVTTDPEALSYAVINGLPVPNRTSTGPQGSLAFVGVPAGPVALELTTADGRLVTQASTFMRGGTATGGFLSPLVYSAEEICGPDDTRVTPGRDRGAVRLRPCAQ